jgi:ATP-dependent RNA helicase DeaD
MATFKDLMVEENILTAIEELKFETPMPIQEKVIPLLLEKEGKDIIALAQTGTGKTAAFGIPIIQKTNVSSNKIQYLVLSPTRELCLQISDDISSYAKYKPGVKIAAVFGGASIDRQIEKIRKGVQIISATPGRLLDLINRNVIDLSHIDTVILDEADEMLNMGFRDDLEEILRTTPKKKNILLFSATMPKEIVAIANSYMSNPVEVTVGKRNAGAENINHVCFLVQAKDRYLALKRIVDFYPEVYGIVFCRTRAETQEVADKLIKDGYSADALHGDLSQKQRDFVMNKFRIRHIQLLVATDVAARGLDVDDLTHIINYNLPEENEIYTHRSGRTGRAGKKGCSIVIANMREKSRLQMIEKKLNKQFTFAEIPGGKEICEKQLFFLIDRMEKVEVDYSQINPLLPDIFKKLEWLDREELIKKFVSVEFNRFLEYYKNAPDLSTPSSSKDSLKHRNGDYNFSRFFINIGIRDGLKPNVLMGLINEFTGVSNIEIGKIELLQNFSFFEVDTAFAEAVQKAFAGQSYKGREINLEVSDSKGKESRGGGRRNDRGGERRGFGGNAGGDRRERRSYGGDSGGERRERRSSGGDAGGERRERRSFGGDAGGERRERRSFGGDAGGERRERRSFGGDAGGERRERRSYGSVTGGERREKSSFGGERRERSENKKPDFISDRPKKVREDGTEQKKVAKRNPELIKRKKKDDQRPWLKGKGDKKDK